MSSVGALTAGRWWWTNRPIPGGTEDVVVNRRHELSLVNPLHEGVSPTR